jgi:hypothetical protein
LKKFETSSKFSVRASTFVYERIGPTIARTDLIIPFTSDNQIPIINYTSR